MVIGIKEKRSTLYNAFSTVILRISISCYSYYIVLQIMALPSFTIDMCFKSFLIQAIEKLPITRYGFGSIIEANGLFRDYVELQMADSEENQTVWGRLCLSRSDATQDAARSVILFLKEKFNFQVRDINWADMNYYKWCYEDLRRDFDKILEENKEMKPKVTEYEDILGIIDGVDREPFTAQNF
ncbi:hypothetical protein LguiA_035518 [Lonicera macranthoides]